MFLKGKKEMSLFIIEVEEEKTTVKSTTKDSNDFFDACRALLHSVAKQNNEEVSVMVGTLVASFIEE